MSALVPAGAVALPAPSSAESVAAVSLPNERLLDLMALPPEAGVRTRTGAANWDGATSRTDRADRADRDARADDDARAAEPVTFATVAGTSLMLPRSIDVTVGFHESGDRRAIPMDPVGTPTHNLNAPRITLPPASADNEYLVLPTRRRANSPTTAVDVRVDPGVPITSPVSGTIEKVTDYALYGRTPDVIVEIIPHERPDLRVRMLHIDGVQIGEGTAVEAGVTVVADTSRQLPFRSQIDRWGGHGPHVHIEVHPREIPAAPVGGATDTDTDTDTDE